jgi:ribosomal protein S18 acetylase RimI-like enzyme
MSCGVAEAHRGKGLGNLVVALVTAMGRHLSPGRPVRLEVWQDNAPAIAAYWRAGYHPELVSQRGGRSLQEMACP